MATQDEIAAVFNVLTTNYGYIQRDKKPAELAALLDIWKQTLSDIDSELLRAATLKIISSSKWFPSVSELREAALDVAEPNGRRSGIEAWGDVVKHFGNGGFYVTPAFDDSIVAEVVKVLGWRNLCVSETPTADRARFAECYDALAARRRNDMLALPEVKRVQARLSERAGQARSEIKKLAEAMSK